MQKTDRISALVAAIPSIYRQRQYSRRTLLLYVAVWFCYSLITLWSAVNHEPWRDEAFIWLMARDLSFSGLFSELRYNGSPGLWHSLVFILAKSGLPYVSQQYMHWALASITAGIFLYFSPFNSLLKIVFLFSYFVLYEHAVVVRVYLLSLALLYIVCILFPTRFQKPLRYGVVIALLANANAFGLFAGAFLGAEYLWSRLRERACSRRQMIAMSIMVTGGLIAAASIYPPNDAFYYYQEHFAFYNPLNLLYGLAIAFVMPGIMTDHILTYGVAIGTLAFGFTAWLMIGRRAYTALSLLISMWLMLMYISVFKYLWPSPRHYSFYLIFLMVALWLASYRPNMQSIMPERALFLLLITGCLFSDYAASMAVDREIYGVPFSGSKKMAQYLLDNHLEHKTIVAYTPARACAILPYLPGTKLWYPTTRSFGTYVHFDQNARQEFLFQQVVGQAQADMHDLSDVYFLFDGHIGPTLRRKMERVYFSGGRWESLWLYRFKKAE